MLDVFDPEGSDIPGHVLEDIPGSSITLDMAAAYNTTPLHINNNRLADFKAKEQAILATAVHPDDRPWLFAAIRETHQRLCCIGKRLGDDVLILKQIAHERSVEEADNSTQPTLYQVQQKFSTWLWHGSEVDFPWQPPLVCHRVPPDKWPLQMLDWTEVCGFLSSCRWQCQPQHTTAFVESSLLMAKTAVVWCWQTTFVLGLFT